jgi:probable HAF family extracellular repeat protein
MVRIAVMSNEGPRRRSVLFAPHPALGFVLLGCAGCSAADSTPSTTETARSALVVLGAAGDDAGAAPVASSYTYVQIGPLPGAADEGSVALAVNDANQVTGTTSAPNDASHAYLWEKGALIDLGVTGTGKGADEDSSGAWALNNAGIAAGNSDFYANDPPYGALFSTSAATSIGTGYGKPGYATVLGLSDTGWAVGVRSASQKAVQGAFLYADGGFTDLGTLGGKSTLPYSEDATAYGVNDAGHIVGEALTPAGTLHAFLWQNGAMSDLGVLPTATTSTATAIDAVGEVVGSSSNPGVFTHATFWSAAGVLHDLGTLPGGTESFAQGMNENHVVVGSSTLATTPTSNAGHAVLWKLSAKGAVTQLIDLNTVVGVPADIELQTAYGINDKGWIVGSTCDYACDAGKQTSGHGFILIPN